MPGNQKPNRARMQNRNRHSPQPEALRENRQNPHSPEYYAYWKKKKYYDMLRRRKRKFLLCVWLLGAGIVLVLAILLYRAAVAPKDPPASVSAAANSTQTTAKADDAWALILANTQNPLPENYEETVTYVQGPTSEQQCDARILEALNAMLNGAAADGYSLYFRSGYRSFATQTYLFDAMCQENVEAGMTEEEAYAATKRLRNIPGTSEHETGLAVDLVPFATPFIDLTDELENTPEIKWLHEHCVEYGFILRYPKGKTDITGTSYEPWHFRYVGVEDATEIMKAGLTLEEYLARGNG